MSKGNGNKDPLLQLLDELRAMRADLNKRLDKLVENTGEHWRDHEDRIRALERRLEEPD